MGKTLELYNECMEGEEESNPVERLRFFCSLIAIGDDWLDIEPFFDDVQAEIDAKDEAIAGLEGNINTLKHTLDDVLSNWKRGVATDAENSSYPAAKTLMDNYRNKA